MTPCIWCGDDLIVGQGWLILPRKNEALIQHEANAIACCVACSAFRRDRHVADYLAECFQLDRDVQVDAIIDQLQRMNDDGVKRAASTLRNVLQVQKLRTPDARRTAKIRPLVEKGRGQCIWCRQPLSISHSEVSFDHLVPQSYGGPDDMINLVLSCRRCNSRRRNTDPITWIQQLIAEGTHPLVGRVRRSLEDLKSHRNPIISRYAYDWADDLDTLAPTLNAPLT